MMNKFITIDEEKIKSKTSRKKILKEYREYKALNPLSIIENDDVVECEVLKLPFKKENTITTKEGLRCAKLLLDNPSLLNGGKLIEYEGQYYYTRYTSFKRCVDTGNEIPANETYRTYRNEYYENRDNLEYHDDSGMFFPKDDKDLVVCKDTGRKIPERLAYNAGSDHYFEFRKLAGIRSGKKLKYNYTKFPKDINEPRIGIELEFGYAAKLSQEVLKNPELRHDWMSVRDGSLDNIENGLEFVSIPLRLEEMYKVEDMIKFAKKNGADPHRDCGYHVHIGASHLTFMDISTLVTLCLTLEDEIFGLFPKSRQANEYCRKMNDKFTGFVEVTKPVDKKKACDKLYSGQNANFEERHKQSKYVDSGGHRGIRYHWLNLDRLYHKRTQPEQKTVEFRLHEATFDYERFINFSILSYYIVKFAKEHSKETCKKVTLADIVRTADYKYRKDLMKYIKTSKPIKKETKKKSVKFQQEYIPYTTANMRNMWETDNNS